VVYQGQCNQRILIHHRPRVLGGAIHFALPAFSCTPNSSRAVVVKPGPAKQRLCAAWVVARSWGSNSLRVTRVLLHPQFIARWSQTPVGLTQVLHGLGGRVVGGAIHRGGVSRPWGYGWLYRVAVLFLSGGKLLFSGFGVNWSYQVKAAFPQKAAQQSIAPDCLKLGFLEMVRQHRHW
jgi:hypothetical protein